MARRKTPRRRSRKRSDRYTPTVAFGIVIALVVIVFALWDPAGMLGKRATRKSPAPGAEKAEKKETPPAKPAPERKEKTGLIALVIDDLGQDLKPAREILDLPGEITIAVLPGLPHSQEISSMAVQKGRDVLLHLPMERKNNKEKPEALGTLRSDMTPLEFMSAIAGDIASVPGAVGVNNHEGSALTENREAMKFLMAELKARDLRFLDSLTSPRSVAYATAKEFGVKAARRSVFIDNSENPAAIRKQLAELLRIAQKSGRAVGVGHPHPATLDELGKWLPLAEEQGIEIVPVSKLMQ